MTGTNCDLLTHKSSRSYLNHLVFIDLLLNKPQCGRCSAYVNIAGEEFLQKVTSCRVRGS